MWSPQSASLSPSRHYQRELNVRATQNNTSAVHTHTYTQHKRTSRWNRYYQSYIKIHTWRRRANWISTLTPAKYISPKIEKKFARNKIIHVGSIFNYSARHRATVRGASKLPARKNKILLFFFLILSIWIPPRLLHKIKFGDPPTWFQTGGDRKKKQKKPLLREKNDEADISELEQKTGIFLPGAGWISSWFVRRGCFQYKVPLIQPLNAWIFR